MSRSVAWRFALIALLAQGAAAAALFAPGPQFVLPYNPNGDATDAGIRRFPAMAYVTVATQSYGNMRFVDPAVTPAANGVVFIEATGDPIAVAAQGIAARPATPPR